MNEINNIQSNLQENQKNQKSKKARIFDFLTGKLKIKNWIQSKFIFNSPNPPSFFYYYKIFLDIIFLDYVLKAYGIGKEIEYKFYPIINKKKEILIKMPNHISLSAFVINGLDKNRKNFKIPFLNIKNAKLFSLFDIFKKESFKKISIIII